MQDLRLVAANDVGSHLLLRSMQGDDFRVPIDERLRAAVRGDRARFGQLEMELGAQLRPRDIQARIRAGQSAEEIAHAAGVPVERVRRFEGPVLAERAHLAQLAQRSSVRRSGQADGPHMVLGTAVTARLDPLGVREEELDWDSWRRDDGRWTVQVTYVLEERPQQAQFVYDARARTTTADDDEARWLVGELAERPATAPFVPRLAPAPAHAAEDAQPDPAGDREPAQRFTPRPPAERPRRASALDILMPPPPAGSRPPERPMPRVERPAAAVEHPAAAVGRPLPRDERPVVQRPGLQPERPRRVIPPEERLTGTADAGPDRSGERPTARAAVRGRRPTVPSWDEILFGTRRGE